MFIEINNQQYVNPDNIISVDKFNTKTRLNDINGNSIITPKPIKFVVNKLNGIRPTARKVCN